MSNNEYISMLVCWKKQRRLINIKNDDDDLNTIEKSIINIYYLKQSNYFQQYQIQYYDEIYKTFIDLCSETIQRFQILIKKLFLLNAPTKDNKIWRLRIIPKATEITHNASCDSTTIDVYKDDEQFDIASDSHSMISEIVVHNDHPLNFHLENDIADRQRKQYESDISRRKNSNNSSIGGVFLRATNMNSTILYPTVQFEIPKSKVQSSWCLYLYILTESDLNGNYYLHASKGIYDGLTMIKDKFGPISNSNLVNPHKIELSPTDIIQGKFEIRLRVCNIRNLPYHKQEKLRKFPELNRFMIYDDTNLISDFTTTNLNFNSEKYHLGCLLVCDYRVQDRCISQITINDRKRKRK